MVFDKDYKIYECAQCNCPPVLNKISGVYYFSCSGCDEHSTPDEDLQIAIDNWNDKQKEEKNEDEDLIALSIVDI